MAYEIRYRIGCYLWDAETENHRYMMNELYYTDEDTARKRYASLAPTEDRPQVELWEELYTKSGALEDRHKIAMKDSTGDYPWWEF